MILPLRQRHRHVFAVLAVVLPVVFVIGIAARSRVPLVTSLSAEISGADASNATVVWERADLFTNAPVNVRLLRGTNGESSLTLSAAGDFAKPDLLAYWTAGALPSGDALPESAVLLGSFAAPRLRLPDGFTTQSGSLILFSLADQEIVGVSKAFKP